MADAHDSKSCVERHVGSTPTPGTILKNTKLASYFLILMFGSRTGKGSGKLPFPRVGNSPKGV